MPMKNTLTKETRLLLLTISLMATCVRAAGTSAPEVRPMPEGFSKTLVGNMHDFDYLIGAWTTRQTRLKARAVGSHEWVEAPANGHCAQPFMGGQVIVEQSQFPNHDPAGLFLYTFDSSKNQWAIRWVNGKSGELESALVGGFHGARGEFYGDDDDDGRPIRVRVIWTNPDRDHARWEQSFSYDDRTWETNWISDFTRADREVICPKT
jgi:hypothetical protein